MEHPGRDWAGPGNGAYFRPFFAGPFLTGVFAEGFAFGAAFTTGRDAVLAFGAAFTAFLGTGFVATFAFAFGASFTAFFGAALAAFFGATFAAFFGAAFASTFAVFAGLPDTLAPSRTAAWPAARRAIGMRNGEQLT